ncbi:MAG: sigma-70 family RNA polymerase sigma factor [Pirellulales bacterium]
MVRRNRRRDLKKRSIPDHWLAQRAVAGGWFATLATHVLFLRHGEIGYRIARTFGLQHADALNAVQEAYVRAIRALNQGKYDPSKGSFGGWFQKILRHECLALLRSRKKYRTIDEFLQSVDAMGAPFGSNPEPTPEEIAIAEQLFDSLNQALETLTHAERAVVEMRHIYGWKLRQIAKYLELSVPRVCQLYQGALKKLRRYFNEPERRSLSPPVISESSNEQQRTVVGFAQRLSYWQASLGNPAKLCQAIEIFESTARRIDLSYERPWEEERLDGVKCPLLYEYAVRLQWNTIECLRQQLLRIQKEPTNIEHHFHLRELLAEMPVLMKELEVLDFRDEIQRYVMWRRAT